MWLGGAVDPLRLRICLFRQIWICGQASALTAGQPASGSRTHAKDFRFLFICRNDTNILLTCNEVCGHEHC